MERAEAGAIALEMLLQADGFACERRYDSIRLSDSGTIIHFQEQDDGDGGGQSVCFDTYTHIPRIDRTIYDVAIGVSYQGRNPFEIAAEAYMGSIIPIVHALTTEHVDCMGVTSDTIYLKDAETGLPLEWRMLMGPLRAINLPPIQAGDHRLFADAIVDLIEPRLTRPDVYWVKCHVSKIREMECDADCFLNNDLFDEGKRRFLEIAERLNGSGRYQSRKQFLAFVPINIDEAIAERDARRRSQWSAAVESHAPGLAPTQCEQVFLGIESLMAAPGCPNSLLDRWLIARGCRVEDACRLPSIVANACARVQWDGHGVDWGGRYVLVNSRTRKGCVGKLDDEPLFQAAMRVINAMKTANVAEDAFHAMLNYSPEHEAISQVQEQGGSLEYLSLTRLVMRTNQEIEGDLDAATLDELGIAEEAPDAPLPEKPWWKFW